MKVLSKQPVYSTLYLVCRQVSNARSEVVLKLLRFFVGIRHLMLMLEGNMIFHSHCFVFNIFSSVERWKLIDTHGKILVDYLEISY